MTDTATAIAMHVAQQESSPGVPLFGTAGKDIFVNRRPPKPHAVIVCTEYSAWRPPEMPMGGGTAQVMFPALQVVVRGTPTETYDVVYARALALWTFLQGINDRTISGEKYTLIPNDQPAPLTEDDEQRDLLVMNFSVTKG